MATDVPAELARLVRESATAKAAWEQLTTSQKRMLSENVAAAKRPATRERRAEREFLGAAAKSQPG